MKEKKRILILYDYFDPAILAGGPTVSCVNLVDYLHEDFEFYIFCTNKDLDGSTLNVSEDLWLDYKGKAKVLYANELWSFRGLWKVLKEVKADVLYINGIFSLVSVIYPLMLANIYAKTAKIIISPRGMLLRSALTEKQFKKKLYLPWFKLLTKINHVIWHVTGKHEQEELVELIPNGELQEIMEIGNVPATAINYENRKASNAELKLLTIALISPMKNILKIIQALSNIEFPVSYTLYGNVKDKDYWEKCLAEAKNLPPSVSFQYKGIAARQDIPAIMSESNIYIQPSKSENFSHSIYEALMSGMPVITSHNTPWHLNEQNAGWNVEPENITELKGAITEAYKLQENDFNSMSKNARQLALEYLNNANLRQGYGRLFESNNLVYN